VKRVTVIAAVLVTAAITCSAPALAVQTSRFGLVASGHRTKLIHPPGDSPVRDTVVVYNRTKHRLTLDLGVVGATALPNGTYNLGAPGAGFAAKVHLASRTVTLAPRALRAVPVTIDRPSHTDHPLYAAITAIEAANGANSGLAIQERLALLVGITAGSSSSGLAALADDPLRLSLVVVAFVLLVGVAVALARRRRRA
jgi:hypothetical protein